ncbi:MAG: phage portal protein [Nocardioidaceae bacterium]
MTTDLLRKLTQKLDESTATYSTLDAYAAGEQPLSYLSPEARASLGNRLQRVSVNIPALVVSSIAERLRITGFVGTPDDPGLWRDWLATDLDQQSGVLHRESLILGSSFAVVWADRDGAPQVSVESARQVAVLTDPGSRRVVAAVKRWATETNTEAVLFLPDSITRLRSDSPGATTAGFRTVEVLRNPLGVVPVVPFVNRARLLDDGRSEMADVLALSDAVVKLSTDMLTASEYGARPRRYATGVELIEGPVLDAAGLPVLDGTGEPVIEETSPYREGDRMLIAEQVDAKFGQLPGSDLAGYTSALDVLMRQISAVSGLPEHALGIGSSNPTSADSIRASEAALTSKAEARQATFGRSWEAVAKLMVAVRHGVDPQAVQIRVKWADPSTRSVAQEADAVTKLFASGLLPASVALAKLGYSTDEITEIEKARKAA